MVKSLFVRLGLSSRYDAVPVVAFRIDNDKQTIQRHSDEDIAFFAVGFSIIKEFNGKGVAKHHTGIFEANPVFVPV